MAIDMDKIEDMIGDHMAAQPYRIECSDCGKSLSYTKEIDNDYDLDIFVDPCKCTKGK